MLWYFMVFGLLQSVAGFLTVPIHILNMVYRPGLTGLTGWLKSRQLTDLYTLFCSTLAYISQRFSTINYITKNLEFYPPNKF